MVKLRLIARLLLASVLLFLVYLVTACSFVTGESNYVPGEEFTLVPGQSAALVGEGLKVSFVEILGDSRCPYNVECIRAGEAKSLVQIDYSNTAYLVVFTQPDFSSSSATDFQGYHFSFDIQPYPETGKTVRPDEYRLILKVTKIAP